jgi:hypothetical protein
MMLVRTTVTLDRDVEALLRKAMRARGEKFKQILNEAIRDGLRAEKSGCTARRFRQLERLRGCRAVGLDEIL